MFDVTYHSEQALVVPTLDCNDNTEGSGPCVAVSCSSSVKEPAQHLYPLGVALNSIWLYITLVCMFDNADAFYTIATMCNLEYIKVAFHNGNGCEVRCIVESEILPHRPVLVCFLNS